MHSEYNGNDVDVPLYQVKSINLTNKGYALINLRKFEDALLVFEEALDKNRHNAKAWSGKGYVLASLGNAGESMVAYNKAIWLDSDDAEIWNSKGFASISLGKNNEALAAFERAIKLSPENSDSWRGKMCILESLGKHKEAEEAYRKLGRLNPACISLQELKVNISSRVGINTENKILFDKRTKPENNEYSEPASSQKRNKTEKRSIKNTFSDTSKKQSIKCSKSPIRGDYAGICPICGSSLVWRKARRTDELYRGCTNYDGGCRYNDRSY